MTIKTAKAENGTMQSDRDKRETKRMYIVRGGSLTPDQLKDLAAPNKAPPLPPPSKTDKGSFYGASDSGHEFLVVGTPHFSRSDSEAPSPPPSPTPSPPASPTPSPPGTPSSTRSARTFASSKSSLMLPPPPSQPPPSKTVPSSDSPNHIAPPPKRPPPVKKLTSSATLPIGRVAPPPPTVNAAPIPITSSPTKSEEINKAPTRAPTKAPPTKLSMAGIAAFKAAANMIRSSSEITLPSDDSLGSNSETKPKPAVPTRSPPPKTTLESKSPSGSAAVAQTSPLPSCNSSVTSVSSRPPSPLKAIAPSVSVDASCNNSSSSSSISHSEEQPTNRAMDIVVKSRSKVGLAAFMSLQSRYSRKDNAAPPPPESSAAMAERKSADEHPEITKPERTPEHSPHSSFSSSKFASLFSSKTAPPVEPSDPEARAISIDKSRRSPSSESGKRGSDSQKRSFSGLASFTSDVRKLSLSSAGKSGANDTNKGPSTPTADPYQRKRLSDPTLPDGWVAIQAGLTERVYYFHQSTQLVTWTRPETSEPPAHPEPDPNLEGLPPGWTAIWSANLGSYYYYNPTTEESTWEMPNEEDENPPPPEGPPPPLEEPPPSTLAVELNFINDVLRPKYGDGKLLTEPGLVESLFVYMVNNASQRHVIFCEFFLSCFRNETMLQQLLKNGWWKRCLLVLISEANDTNNEALDYISMSHNEVLDYVLLTLSELFAYFFRHFDEPHNVVPQLGSKEPLPLGLTGKVTMCSFLMDAANEFGRHRMHGITLKILLALNNRLCDWTIKPRWVTDFSCFEWYNLFSSLEAQEEMLFFHQKDFVLPIEGEFAGLGLLESIVTLLERVKASSLESVPEVDPAIIKLQKIWAVRGAQEYDFFSRVRDFFRYIGDMDACMDKVGAKTAGIIFRAQAPPHCSQAEFSQLLLGRKRLNYGNSSSVQKKVHAYVNRSIEHYKKVFVGEAQLAPRPEMRAFRPVPLINSTGSKIGIANFLKKHSADRQGSIIDVDSSRKSSIRLTGSPSSSGRKLSDVLSRKMSLAQQGSVSSPPGVGEKDDRKSNRSISIIDTHRASLTLEHALPASSVSPMRESPKPEPSTSKKSLFKRRF